jgi:hypothetical protein
VNVRSSAGSSRDSVGWSSVFHTVEAVHLVRSEMRQGEVGLILRCIDDAAERAQHLGKGERTKTAAHDRKARQRERNEMAAWLAEKDDGRPFSLGWCCNALEVYLGKPFCKERIAAAIGGLLAGSRTIRREPTHKRARRAPSIWVRPSESDMTELT